MKTFLKLTAASTAIAALAAPALAAEPLISAEELQGMLGSDDLVIIDIRSDLESATNEDYGKGHIPGAVYANYKKAGWRGDRGAIHYMLPDTEKIEDVIQGLGVDEGDYVVVYGAGVSPKALDLGATTRVFWTFKALGHDNVSILDGGIKAWTDAGYELSADVVVPAKGTFEAEPDPSYLVDGDMVAAAIENAVELVDSRPGAQFKADAQPGYARNPGTIPTAVNVPAPSMVGEGGIGFKDAGLIEKQFASVGVDAGDSVYSFCNTGHHASVVWFAATQILDLDFKLYDGSIYDWTQVRMGPTVIGQNPDPAG